jgi:coenzyme PQQ biosynthesis protein PqqD
MRDPLGDARRDHRRLRQGLTNVAVTEASRPALSKKARLVWDRVEMRHMLLYPERGLALNPVAAAVVRELGKGLSVGEIASTISGEFSGAEPDSIAVDVIAFLNELEARALLVKEST